MFLCCEYRLHYGQLLHGTDVLSYSDPTEELPDLTDPEVAKRYVRVLVTMDSELILCRSTIATPSLPPTS